MSSGWGRRRGFGEDKVDERDVDFDVKMFDFNSLLIRYNITIAA